jgi:hypothetical protein
MPRNQKLTLVPNCSPLGDPPKMLPRPVPLVVSAEIVFKFHRETPKNASRLSSEHSCSYMVCILCFLSRSVKGQKRDFERQWNRSKKATLPQGVTVTTAIHYLRNQASISHSEQSLQSLSRAQLRTSFCSQFQCCSNLMFKQPNG